MPGSLFFRAPIAILAITALLAVTPVVALSQKEAESPASISDLVPASVASGSGSMELIVRGAGFTHKSQVRINGRHVSTKFTSANELRAKLAAKDVASPGSFAVSVFTGAHSSTNSVALAVIGSNVPPAAVLPDTEAPRLENFGTMFIPATSASGVGVTFRTPNVTDNSGSATVTCDPPAYVNFNFPIGSTPVTCTARDASGNVATVTFTITITPPATIP